MPMSLWDLCSINYEAMKKTICTALFVLGLFGLAVATSGSAGAVNVFQPCGVNGQVNARKTDVCQEVKSNKYGANPIITTLGIVLNILSLIVGIATVTVIIIGGFKFVTSGSDPAGAKSARETIVYALIGIVIVVFAQTIVAFVLNKF